MSLYDFSHIPYTSLVLLPSPSESTLWVLFKTFGPGFIAGCIAGMALKVALTQREIAANKYDLDLFDKRYEIFENFIPCYDKINKLDIKEYDYDLIESSYNGSDVLYDVINMKKKQWESINSFIEEDLLLIVNKLEKASRIFGKIQKKEVEDFKKKLYKFKEAKKEFYDELYTGTNTHEIPTKLYTILRNGMKINYNNDIKNLKNKILDYENKNKEYEQEKNKIGDDNYYNEQIEKNNEQIEEIKNDMKSFDDSFQEYENNYRKNNKKFQYLIKSMYSLKSEFLDMYHTMDTYLSIKEDAYKKRGA